MHVFAAWQTATALAVALCAGFALAEQGTSRTETAGQASANLAAKFASTCLTLPSSLCLTSESGNATKTFKLSSDATPSALTAMFSFDHSHSVDESGNDNHMTVKDGAKVVSGPGVGGKGAGASFDGEMFAKVPAKALDSKTFTVAFWLFLRQDSIGRWRTIVSKGETEQEMTPTILLNADDRRLRVSFSSADDWNDGFVSSGPLPLRRWTHLALTVSCDDGGDSSLARLFINGVKDRQKVVNGEIVVNKGDLRVGRDEWRAGTISYVDDLRLYSRGLSEAEVLALQLPRVTGIPGERFASLGCLNCNRESAVKACDDVKHAHLCTLQELYAGGFHLARVQGWLTSNPEVHFSNDLHHHAADPTEMKLGMCCMDLDEDVV